MSGRRAYPQPSTSAPGQYGKLILIQFTIIMIVNSIIMIVNCNTVYGKSLEGENFHGFCGFMDNRETFTHNNFLRCLTRL